MLEAYIYDGLRTPFGRHAGSLSDLLARRPDLRGVHAPADWLEDAIRWTA